MTGTFEIKPTKNSMITITPLVILYSGEQVCFPVFLSMACDLASRCSRRFPPNSLSNTVPFIMGTISEPIIQKYSLTASNALSESSLEFTLAVDKCPEGLSRLS